MGLIGADYRCNVVPLDHGPPPGFKISGATSMPVPQVFVLSRLPDQM
jgi:hypothetical protein